MALIEFEGQIRLEVDKVDKFWICIKKYPQNYWIKLFQSQLNTLSAEWRVKQILMNGLLEGYKMHAKILKLCIADLAMKRQLILFWMHNKQNQKRDMLWQSVIELSPW